ncbi:MAG TPA: sugar phosphate isomerase/epimerase [Bryobacteraceae bacterium]|nr:sugar phosphate isomerase/epimerase [Bryobacteraceae bacterium]
MPPEENSIQLGCQTNAWRMPAGDTARFLNVLARIRSYGFDGFETGFLNIETHLQDLPGARRRIEDAGVRFFAVHIFLLQYDPETFLAPEDLIQRVARGARELGAERMILSGAPAARDGKFDLGAVQRKAAALNRAALSCFDAGLRLAYHNHPPEFLAGGEEIRSLIAATDPTLVSFVLDTGHMSVAGADGVGFFREYHERTCALHLRDFAGSEQVPLGYGTLDLSAWKKAIDACGWRGWAIAEEERPNDGRPGDTAVAPASNALRRTFRPGLAEARHG